MLPFLAIVAGLYLLSRPPEKPVEPKGEAGNGAPPATFGAGTDTTGTVVHYVAIRSDGLANETLFDSLFQKTGVNGQWLGLVETQLFRKRVTGARIAVDDPDQGGAVKRLLESGELADLHLDAPEQ